jgi:MFS family permease
MAHAPAAPGPRRGWGETFSALRYRNYRLLWITTLLVSGGNWIQQITLGWLAKELTDSPLKVSIVVGLRTIPMLASPMVGVLADRVDRRKLLMIDQVFLTFLGAGFAADLLTGSIREWHLYVFAVLAGVGWAFTNPVRQVLVANSVPRPALMNAIALNSMAFNSMRMLGPAAGGFLIAFFGPGVNFALQAVMYALVVVLMVPYRAEYASNRRREEIRSPFHELWEGFRYMLHQPVIRTGLAMSFIATICYMSFITTQAPVFVADVLGDDSGRELGLLLFAMGVGGFVGTIVLARLTHVQRKGLLVLTAVAGAGAGLMGLSFTSVLWASMVVMAVQQFCFITVMTTDNTILQSITPDHMRGRVMGVYMLDIGLQPLGGVTAGIIAEMVSVQAAWFTGGAIGLAACIGVALIAPGFRALRVG